MADEPGVAQLGQRAEVLGDRVGAARRAQVDHVEVVAAELAQVLLDLAAQLVRPWPQAATRPTRPGPGPTLVTMTRSSGYGASARLISSFAERSGEK